jgi:hypothetical protein
MAVNGAHPQRHFARFALREAGFYFFSKIL